MLRVGLDRPCPTDHGHLQARGEPRLYLENGRSDPWGSGRPLILGVWFLADGGVNPALPLDIDRIAAIHRAARAESMPWLAVVHSETEDRWFFEHQVLPMQTVQAAEIDGAVVGFAAFGDGWLHHLYVAPNAWRRGVGAGLVSQMQDASAALQL